MSLRTLLAFDISNKFLQKNDILMGYSLSDKDFICSKWATSGFRNYRMNYRILTSYFDTFTFAYRRSFNDHWKGAVQVF